MWSVSPLRNAQKLKRIDWSLFLHLLFLSLWNDVVFHTKTLSTRLLIYRSHTAHRKLHTSFYVCLPKKRNPLHHNTLQLDFKIRDRVKSSTIPAFESSPSNPKLQYNLRQSTSGMDLFRTYLRVTSLSAAGHFAVHQSFRFLFLKHSASSSTVTSLSGLFARWQVMYYFLFNLFYFDTELMVFGTSFFKKELLSFNWKVTNSLKFIWRYTLPFLYLRSNKITDYGYYVFNKLRLSGLRTAFVVDVMYHSKTLYYLHRSHFYTLGVVPTNVSAFSVNFAVPTAVDSVFSQLFFIRFVIKVRRAVNIRRYNSLRSDWLGFYSTLRS